MLIEESNEKSLEPDFLDEEVDPAFKQTPAFMDMVKLFICMTRMPRRAKKPRIHLTYLRQAYRAAGRMHLRIV